MQRNKHFEEPCLQLTFSLSEKPRNAEELSKPADPICKFKIALRMAGRQSRYELDYRGESARRQFRKLETTSFEDNRLWQTVQSIRVYRYHRGKMFEEVREEEENGVVGESGAMVKQRSITIESDERISHKKMNIVKTKEDPFLFNMFIYYIQFSILVYVVSLLYNFVWLSSLNQKFFEVATRLKSVEDRLFRLSYYIELYERGGDYNRSYILSQMDDLRVEISGNYTNTTNYFNE